MRRSIKSGNTPAFNKSNLTNSKNNVIIIAGGDNKLLRKIDTGGIRSELTLTQTEIQMAVR